MFNTTQLNRIEKKLDVLIAKMSVMSLPPRVSALDYGKWLFTSKPTVPDLTAKLISKPPAKKRGRPFKDTCNVCGFKGKNKRSVAQHKRHNHK